jgi:hypothetical protein
MTLPGEVVGKSLALEAADRRKAQFRSQAPDAASCDLSRSRSGHEQRVGHGHDASPNPVRRGMMPEGSRELHHVRPSREL